MDILFKIFSSTFFCWFPSIISFPFNIRNLLLLLLVLLLIWRTQSILGVGGKVGRIRIHCMVGTYVLFLLVFFGDLLHFRTAPINSDTMLDFVVFVVLIVFHPFSLCSVHIVMQPSTYSRMDRIFFWHKKDLRFNMFYAYILKIFRLDIVLPVSNNGLRQSPKFRVS